MAGGDGKSHEPVRENDGNCRTASCESSWRSRPSCLPESRYMRARACFGLELVQTYSKAVFATGLVVAVRGVTTQAPEACNGNRHDC